MAYCCYCCCFVGSVFAAVFAVAVVVLLAVRAVAVDNLKFFTINFIRK